MYSWHRAPGCRGSHLTAVGKANEGHTLNPLDVPVSVTPLKTQLLIEHVSFPGKFGVPTTLYVTERCNQGIQQNACDERVYLLSD